MEAEGTLGVLKGAAIALETSDHERAFERRDDEICDALRIDRATDLTVGNSLFYDLADSSLPLCECVLHEGSKQGVAVVGVNGSVQQGAAAGQW